MTIFTPRTNSKSRRGVTRRTPGGLAARGFTLAEVMIAATISSFVLAGVLSAFLMIGRTGFIATSYSTMEGQTRLGLETFGNDVRKAVNLRWNSAQSITLSLVTATNATTQVTYAYDAGATGATAGCFYRVLGDAASTLPRRVLVRNVAPEFSFQRFKIDQTGLADNTATNDLETKQIQVTFRALRARATTAVASQSALSARYVLRNKRVTN